jgi:trehalose-6-phosphate synthase
MEQRGCARFKLKAETHPGQTIKILGSHPSLGLWNPDNAVELSTNEIIYPDWTTQLIFLPLNTCIEYKYIFKSLDNITWEASYNRKITLIQNNALIEDVHGNPVSKVFYSSVGIHETEEVFNEDVKFDDSNTVLIVSYLLPLTATISDTGSWNFELTKVVWQSQLYNVIKNSKINFMWLGLAGIHPNTEDQQQDLISTMKEKFNCIPIFVDKEDLELHELFFSKVLYKIMHNIIDTSINAGLNSNEELWNAYKRVNIYFSDQILANYTGQMIWIHGSQLLLIPSYISRKTREILNIGFFLHHPFPSSEIYRVFPHREAILHALCCCDLIGFHLFEYARNFFGCCKRVLSLDIELTKGGYLGLNYYGRHIMVKSEHIGIQPQMIEKICAGVIYKNTFETLSGKYEGKKVILSIDAPFELAGIPLKLKAFQLAKRNIKEKVVFLQILVSHSYNFETAGVKQQIFEIQKEINAEYNDQVLEIIEKDLTNEERYAYMAISSGLVISSIKDGLCLQPFEYLIIKKDKQCGVVLSEFTGVSTALNSPIKVNPFNVKKI